MITSDTDERTSDWCLFLFVLLFFHFYFTFCLSILMVYIGSRVSPTIAMATNLTTKTTCQITVSVFCLLFPFFLLYRWMRTSKCLTQIGPISTFCKCPNRSTAMCCRSMTDLRCSKNMFVIYLHSFLFFILAQQHLIASAPTISATNVCNIFPFSYELSTQAVRMG